MKDALNQEYIYTYDPLGRVLTETRAGATRLFEYDAVGNRTKRTNYDGTVTNYTYDDLNRLTGGPLGTYAYDELSRMLTATNYYGTVSFTYDNRGRVDTTTDVYGKVIDYDYDAAGNRTLMKLDGTSFVSYVYDNAGRLQSITNVPESAVTNYGYDIADRLISKALPNGITTSYNYDDMSRLTRIKDANTSATLLDRQYGYDTANRIATITTPTRTKTYSYDNVDRLTGVTDSISGTVESYAYDAVGNRTNSHLSSTYSHNPFNRLASTDSASYTYDGNGAMASRTDENGVMNLQHDADGRLLLAYNDYYEFAEYHYDALGRRIYKSDPYDLPRRFTYDGEDMLVLNWGGLLSTYLNGPGIDNKLSARIAGGTASMYYHSDHLGTTTGTSNATGALSANGSPDSFGNSDTDFTGREYDTFTGLYFYRARMYDPALGRFTAEDPIGFEGGDINLYGYVHSNPVNRVDPFGLVDLGWGSPTGPRVPYSHLPPSPPVHDPVFGDGGYLSGPTISEFFSATERAKRKCNSTWAQRFGSNFYETNGALPGFGAPSIIPGLGLGSLTSGATARAMNSMTFLEWAREGFHGARIGAGTLSVAETGLTVAASTVVNAVLVTAAYEGGVGIGSAINATFGYTDYCPCGG